MKKKYLKGIVGACIAAMGAVAVAAAPLKDFVKATPNYHDCTYLWDHFDPLYNTNLYETPQTISTWGTITDWYGMYDENDDGTYLMFQNTSAEGQAAGAALFFPDSDIPDDLWDNDFVLVTGTYTYGKFGSIPIFTVGQGASYEAIPIDPYDVQPLYLDTNFRNNLDDLKLQSGRRAKLTGEIVSIENHVIQVLPEGLTTPVNVKCLVADEFFNWFVLDYAGDVGNVVTVQGSLSVENGDVVLYPLSPYSWSDPNDDPNVLTNLYFDDVDYVRVGNSYQIQYTPVPSTADTSGLVFSTYSSTIEVTSSGKVTAKSVGSACVTVTDTNTGNVYYKIFTVVGANAPTSMILNTDDLVVAPGGSAELDVTLLPSDSDQRVTYSLSYFFDQVGYVEDGVYYAPDDAEEGSYVGVEVTSVGNESLSRIIHILIATPEANPIQYIDLSAYNKTLIKGDTFTLTYEAQPSNCDNPAVTWSSDDESVATVSSSGLVTAIGQGTTRIYCTSVVNSSISEYCNITVYNEDPGIMLNVSSINVGSYTTNWTTYNGRDLQGNIKKFGFYRAGNNGKFYPSSNLNTADSDSLPGFLCNSDPLPKISKITVTYKGTGKLKLGASKDYTSTQNLSTVTSLTTREFNVTDNMNYFQIEASGALLTIDSLSVKYDRTATAPANTKGVTTNSRAAATKFSGTLVDGVSYVDIPTSAMFIGNQYVVNSTKRLTYYSWEYVSAHASSLDLTKVAMTDPKDVAAYYIAFGAIPANYYGLKDETGSGYKSAAAISTSKSEVKAIFGDATRAVQQFNRKSGYAVHVPYTSSNYYLECDIDLDGTYGSSRGSNRVVIWVYGWTNTNGDAAAVLTDDHYATFREYNNLYGWNSPFDAQTDFIVTNKTYGNSTLVTRA